MPPMLKLTAAAARIVLLSLLASLQLPALRAVARTGQSAAVTVPALKKAPAIEDFLDMKPSDALAGQMIKVENFIQERPSDGQPASQRTEAYLGYDEKNLFAVFVCFDSEPGKIRARMVSRENFVDERGAGIDDLVSVTLDTYNDRRRAYVFQVNPLGIQWDGLAVEGAQFDSSFDALWYSSGRLTDRGYVVWISIPFKSLRFSPAALQTWGILLNRDIPRNNESSFWPRHTPDIAGFISQAVPMHGLQDISPGRNMQFIPYGVFRSFRALDYGDALQPPRFASKRGEADAGLDSKFILKDSLVLDITVNPDFSQVESDEPQIQANERFELYYPEKRPFFIENAGYFATSNPLLFTRRIADPQFGARLTGKVGPYAIGLLAVDDQAPGKAPAIPDIADKRAYFGVMRISRDIFKESSIGFIFTDREFEGSYNRVGGIDGRFRILRNWTASFQAVTSSTRRLSGSYLAGPAYDFALRRSGRQFNYGMQFRDRSLGFRTDPGFLQRPDLREMFHQLRYSFRPEGRVLIAWGPQIEAYNAWDHKGHHLNWLYSAGMQAELRGPTVLGIEYAPEFELLRPSDYAVLTSNRGYRRHTTVANFETNYLKKLSLQAEVRRGLRINVVPVSGQQPELAGRTAVNFTATLRPITPLRIDNTYLLLRLTDRHDGASIFSSHVLRSKWNWQFTRELSLRLILQYDGLLANPARTSLPTSKNFNTDFLITYLVHPGTAIYLGYNSNLQNIDLIQTPLSGPEIIRTNGFNNDSRGFFVKASYLFRF